MAAESVGLEICYIGSVLNNRVEVIEFLGGNIKTRLPLHSVLHWETFYCASADDSLRTYAASMIAIGIYKGRQVSFPDKPEEIEEYGWMEYSALRSSQAVLTELRLVLEKQGFSLK